MSKVEQLEKQYKLAIDARDKLNDNYYKWMSYYYLANAGIVVAITTLYSKDFDNVKGILSLSILGMIICTLWHLSCKGYYYWSKSWIYLIYYLESEIEKETGITGIYSLFSKEVAEKEDKILLPNKPANVSTPKLTLIFSATAIMCWLLFTYYEFFAHVNGYTLWGKVITMLLTLAVALIFYAKVLPTFIKSRTSNKHKLV
jgi:hypothetical protein